MHVIFRTLPYVSVLNVESDELHILHLGVSQYLLGSVLWLLAYNRPGPAQQNIQQVWEMILGEYDSRTGGCQFTTLGLSSFINIDNWKTEYPRLRGRGAEVKGLASPLKVVWQRLAVGSPYRQDVARALGLLEDLHKILDENSASVHLPLDEAGKFVQATDGFLATYTALGHMADRQGHLLFSAVPKLHWLWHMAARAAYINPRRVACFLDEDFVRHMKRLASHCTAGTQLHNVPNSVLAKYRWAVYLERLAL